MHLDLWRCHQRYGEYVRYAPNRLSVSRLDAVNDIYVYGKNLQKGKGYSAWPVHPGAFNVHNSTDKNIHGRKKRVIIQALSPAALRSAEPFILPHIRDFILELIDARDGIPKHKPGDWSTPKNCAEYCERVILDVLTDLAFGQSFHTLTNPDTRFSIKAINKHLHRQNLAFTFPELFQPGHNSWLSVENWLLPEFSYLRKQYVELGKQVSGKNIKVLQKEKETGQSLRRRKDILDYIINAEDPETGSKFNMAEILSESNVLLSAGGDTTSLAISALLFYLSRSPASYIKLTQEIRTAFRSFADIRHGPLLSSLQYLRACIDEAMRMSPAIGSVLWREAQDGGARITADRIVIGAGCEVGTPTYALHHNEEIWGSDSFEYKPERWIESPENPKERIKQQSKAFIPFSAGSRACLGKPLAMLECNLIIARLLYALDFKLPTTLEYGPEWAYLGQGGSEGYGVGGWGQSADAGVRCLGKEGKELGRHRENEYQLFDQFTAGKSGPGLVWRLREEITLDDVMSGSDQEA